MDLQRLKTFLKIAELGSLSKASDRLRIAQPALSRQVRLLEDEIGAPLFTRHRRGMELTPAGEELALRVSGLLRQLDQAIEEVRSLSGAGGGQVSFGIVPTVSYILAGRLAVRVAKEAPEISLRIVEGYAVHLIEWLQRGEIDIAIFYGPDADFHMNVEELMLEELVVVGPPDSDLDPSKSLAFADFAKLPLVLPSRPNGLRLVVENAAIKAKAQIEVRFEADSFRVLKDLVENGLGYTALPFSSISREHKEGRLKYAPLAHPKVTRQLILGLPTDFEPSRAARTVVRLARSEIADLVGSGEWQAYLQFAPDGETRPKVA